MSTPSLSLRRLMLRDFRSHAALEAHFAAPILCLFGPNGAGKTNLLEAISLLGPGRGLRNARVAELGRRMDGAPLPWAAAGRFDSPSGDFDLGTGTPPDGPPERRVFRLDGEPVRAQGELASRVAAVWLTPQMDRLFQEGASGRRRFLDRLVWALEPAHAREVAAHDNAMAQRNRLLGEGRADAAWLTGLEDAMARHAVAASAARRDLAQRLNATLAARNTALPGTRLDLLCPITEALGREPALAVEDRLRSDLAANRRRDAAAGGAAMGAHRADMGLFHLPKGQSAEFCSTGEQKALLVSVVLGHAALIAEARGFAPLLLLDEATVHLDEERREALFETLRSLPAQAFLTGTDSMLFAQLRGTAEFFHAEPGILHPEGA